MKNVSLLSLLDYICPFLIFPKSSLSLSIIIFLLLCLMHIVYARLFECFSFLVWLLLQVYCPPFIWGCTGNRHHRPTLFNTACSHVQCLIERKKDTLHITAYIVPWTSRRGRWVSLPVGKLLSNAGLHVRPADRCTTTTPHWFKWECKSLHCPHGVSQSWASARCSQWCFVNLTYKSNFRKDCF